MEVGLSPGDFLFDGDTSPSQKGGVAPSQIFGPCLLWLNGWMDQDGTWHGRGPWSRPHCARWGTGSPPPKRGQSPLQFSAHFYCRQTAGCTKINKMQQDATWYGGRPQPGDFVLDGDPSSPPLKVHSSNFCPMSVVAKRLGG